MVHRLRGRTGSARSLGRVLCRRAPQLQRVLPSVQDAGSPSQTKVSGEVSGTPVSMALCAEPRAACVTGQRLPEGCRGSASERCHPTRSARGPSRRDCFQRAPQAAGPACSGCPVNPGPAGSEETKAVLSKCSGEQLVFSSRR